MVELAHKFEEKDGKTVFTLTYPEADFNLDKSKLGVSYGTQTIVFDDKEVAKHYFSTMFNNVSMEIGRLHQEQVSLKFDEEMFSEFAAEMKAKKNLTVAKWKKVNELLEKYEKNQNIKSQISYKQEEMKTFENFLKYFE